MSSPPPTWWRSSPSGPCCARPGRGTRVAVRSTKNGRRASSVNAADKLYYCFGCGKGGDVVSFVRETENLDFVGAIELLAERFRVQLEYEEASPRDEERRKQRARLHEVLEQATAFFERHLWESAAGKPVRAYLAGRGLRRRDRPRVPARGCPRSRPRPESP